MVPSVDSSEVPPPQSANPFFPADCFVGGFGSITAFYILENMNKFVKFHLPIFIPVTIQHWFLSNISHFTSR